MKRTFAFFLLLICVLTFCACSSSSEDTLQVEDIRAVCQLATLKCFYNNVAILNKEADNIFQKDREMWIEYEGEAVIGVDMSKATITITGNTVNITLPKAQILSIAPVVPTLNEDSYIVSSDGWLFKNKITAEDQEAAINLGQEEMKEAILANNTLLTQAEERAKELIENYINQLGNATGKKYTIVWNR